MTNCQYDRWPFPAHTPMEATMRFAAVRSRRRKTTTLAIVLSLFVAMLIGPVSPLNARPARADTTCSLPTELSIAIFAMDLGASGLSAILTAPAIIDFATSKWCTLKPAEQSVCQSNYGECAFGFAAMLYAQNNKANLINDPDAMADGREDASQHCLWQLMSAWLNGTAWAQQIGYAHETIPNETFNLDIFATHAMDLHNNIVARALVGAVNSPDDVFSNCRTVIGRAVWVQRNGTASTDNGVNVTGLINQDPYNGSFANRIVYLTSPNGWPSAPHGSSPDTRSPYSPDWSNYPVNSPFKATYESMSDNTGPLGPPASLQFGTTDGLRQNFQNGYMTYINANGVVYVYFNNSRGFTMRSLSTSNRSYVSGELGYGEPYYGLLRARAASKGSWESWTLVQLANNNVAIQSTANGKYVSAEIGSSGNDYARLRARATAIGSWEQYTLSYNSDGSYSLKSAANGRYVTVQTTWSGSLQFTLRATASSIGQHEKFTEVTSNNTPGCLSYGSGMTGPFACSGFSTTGTWFDGGGVGYSGKEIWTYANGSVKDSSAVYHLGGMDNIRVFQVQAWIPDGYSNSPNAHYIVSSPGGGTADTYINQQNYTNAWVTIGYVCTTDGTATAALWDDGGAGGGLIVGSDVVRTVRTNYLC
jgi:Domain of unknown function (DUF6973)